MISRPKYRMKRLPGVLLTLFLVQLACGGLSPTDPRIPESINSMADNFGTMLGDMDFLPWDPSQPPLITQLEGGIVSGLGSIASENVPGEPPVRVYIYRIQLQGCEQEPLRGEKLGETSVDFAGNWTIQHEFKPNEVIGATQILNGQESGLSNLMVNIPRDQFLTIENLSEVHQTSYETFRAPTVSGKAVPGACVILQDKNVEYGRVASVVADGSGAWQIKIPLHSGENSLRVFVKDWEDIGHDFTLQGFTPLLQWPYRKQNGDVNEPDYTIPVTGFFGPNDYYVVNGFGFHDGLDIGGKDGTPVYAIADGEVFFVQFSNVVGCGGNSVYIDHGGWGSFYLHLSGITVDSNNKGTSKFYEQPIKVTAGQQIGKTGTSGLSGSQYHLHVSAFRWLNGTRKSSFADIKSNAKSDCYIKDLKFSPWPVSRFGVLYNLNPPVDRTLSVMAYKDPKTGDVTAARTVSSTDRLQHCISHYAYWDMNWEQIPIKEYGDPDILKDAVGTQFDWNGKDEKCAIP